MALQWLMAVRIGESRETYEEQLKLAIHTGELDGQLPITCSSCGRAFDGVCLPSYNVPGDFDCSICFRVKSFVMFHEGRRKMKALMAIPADDDVVTDSDEDGPDVKDWTITVNVGDERRPMTRAEVYEAAESQEPCYMPFMTNPLSSDVRIAILMANRLWNPTPNAFATYYEYHQAVVNVADGLTNALRRGRLN